MPPSRSSAATTRTTRSSVWGPGRSTMPIPTRTSSPVRCCPRCSVSSIPRIRTCRARPMSTRTSWRERRVPWKGTTTAAGGKASCSRRRTRSSTASSAAMGARRRIRSARCSRPSATSRSRARRRRTGCGPSATCPTRRATTSPTNSSRANRRSEPSTSTTSG